MEPMGQAKVVTECGHEFCTLCFARNMATNTGTEEGTTRHLCMLCRSPVGPEVKPSMQFQMRLESAEGDRDDFWNELVSVRCECDELAVELRENALTIDRLRTMNKRRGSAVRTLDALCHRYNKLLSYHCDGTTEKSTITIQTWWRGISERRIVTTWKDQLTTIMSYLSVASRGERERESYSRYRAALVIQNSRRTFVARRRVQLEKHRQSWTIYKKIIKDTYELVNAKNIYSRDHTN